MFFMSPMTLPPATISKKIRFLEGFGSVLDISGEMISIEEFKVRRLNRRDAIEAVEEAYQKVFNDYGKAVETIVERSKKTK